MALFRYCSTADGLQPNFIDEFNNFEAKLYLDVKNSKGYEAIAVQWFVATLKG